MAEASDYINGLAGGFKLMFNEREHYFNCNPIRPSKPGEFVGVVFGADTESCRVPGGWEPQLLTFCDHQGSLARWIAGDDCPLEKLLDIIEERYQENIRQGNVPDIYGYFHNLEYDWGQLIKGHNGLYQISKLTKIMMPVDIIVGGRNITLKWGLFKGNVCAVSMKVTVGHGEYNLFLRDTFAFFQTSLAKLGEIVGQEKLERPEDIGNVDYRQMDDCKEKQDFVTYALVDAEVTYKVARYIISMHEAYDIGTPSVSAASFATAVVRRQLPVEFMKGVGGKRAQQFALNCYYGGRFGSVVVGRVEGINVYDFHSSYPAALSALPLLTRDTSVMRYTNISLDRALELVRRFPCSFVQVSGEEKDARYPALIGRIDNNLVPVYGSFEGIYTTGAEFLAGVMLGGLQNVKVHELWIWHDNNNFWRGLMGDLYRQKQESPKDSIKYHTAKVVINSVYGKFIETHKAVLLGGNYDMMVPVPSKITFKEQAALAKEYYTVFVSGAMKGEDPFDAVAAYVKEKFKDAYAGGKGYAFMPLLAIFAGKEDFGFFACPPLAAAVTGIARARLYMLIKTVQGYYWDTDSVFTTRNPEEMERLLSAIPEGAYQAGVPKVWLGDNMGELGMEEENAVVFIAGIKRYYVNEKKNAVHSMPLMPKALVRDAITSLIEKGEFTYVSKEKALSITEADNLSKVGEFTEGQTFNIKLQLDSKMVWRKDGDLYCGKYRPWRELAAGD